IALADEAHPAQEGERSGHHASLALSMRAGAPSITAAALEPAHGRTPPEPDRRRTTARAERRGVRGVRRRRSPLEDPAEVARSLAEVERRGRLGRGRDRAIPRRNLALDRPPRTPRDPRTGRGRALPRSRSGWAPRRAPGPREARARSASRRDPGGAPRGA